MFDKLAHNFIINQTTMSLLIVIGDPHLLGGDPTWMTFLKHCIQLGAYTGCDLPLGLMKLE